MLKVTSDPVALLTHTTHLEYTQHARRRTERERAATLVALDKDLSAQKDIWRGRSLHAALLQGERERTQVALAKAVSEEPPIDEEGGTEGKHAKKSQQQARNGKQAKKGKPKGEGEISLKVVKELGLSHARVSDLQLTPNQAALA
jgi:hypothetical protein